MPKRRISEYTTEPIFLLAEPLRHLMNQEAKAYLTVKQQEENIKNLPKDQIAHATAVLYWKKAALEMISMNIDGAVEEEQQSQGETQIDVSELDAYKQARTELDLMEYDNSVEFLHRKEIQRIENNVKMLMEALGTDEPLPPHFLPFAVTEEPYTDETLQNVVRMEKEGTLEGFVKENITIIDERLLPPEEAEEVKEESKDEEIEEAGKEEEKKEEEEKEEEKREEKLPEEVILYRKNDVSGIISKFYEHLVNFVNPMTAIRTIEQYAITVTDMFRINGQRPEVAYADLLDPNSEADQKEIIEQAIENDLKSGEKQITFIEPEVLTDGKVVPGEEKNAVLIADTKENLQALADNYHNYEAVRDMQLQELNTLKEEFGKTQEIPKANFGGASEEGSEYYRNMTQSLHTCITMLEEMKSGKKMYTPEALQGALLRFKEHCETYVEKRHGRLFGPVTDDGKARLALGQQAPGKVDRMVENLKAASAGISSNLVVTADGKTFNHLNINEKKAYIEKLENDGVIERKPQEEFENKVAVEDLKKISVMEYTQTDYSGLKNGKYMSAARDVILGRHFDIVNRGAKADRFDVARVRNFETNVNTLSTNSAFRRMIDREGIRAAIAKWPEVERNTALQREQIQKDFDSLLTKNGQKLTTAEYIAGVDAGSFSEYARNQNAEIAIEQMAKDNRQMESAYERMTDVIVNKLLIENDKFGKEFINNMVMDEKINDVNVYDQLKHVTKQILTQNHVLEGKALPKALKQLDSGKLGEDLVNSVKEVYKNETRRRMAEEKKEKDAGKDLGIKAKEAELSDDLRSAMPKQLDDEKLAQHRNIMAYRKAYMNDALALRADLKAMDTGFSQEKMEKFIKYASAAIIRRNPERFNSPEAIEKVEKAFFANGDTKATLYTMLEENSGYSLVSTIDNNNLGTLMKDTITSRENMSAEQRAEVMKEGSKLEAPEFKEPKVGGGVLDGPQQNGPDMNGPQQDNPMMM